MSKLRSIHNEREAALNHSRKTQQNAIHSISEPSTTPYPSKPKEVIVLDSSEDEIEEDDGDNMLFVSSTKWKRAQAYERTHHTMRLRARQR
jgi:hypothetical protein